MHPKKLICIWNGDEVKSIMSIQGSRKGNEIDGDEDYEYIDKNERCG